MYDIMCSAVGEKDFIIFDIGVGKRGEPIYRITWYNGKKTVSAVYRSFEAARTTWKLLTKSLDI
jgi:hypothetical protein